jgi:hypothetical protein
VGAPPDDWHSLLGRKVSVRFRLHGDPSHRFSEAVGVVQAVGPASGGDAVVSILKRHGEVVEVAARDVLACKLL